MRTQFGRKRFVRSLPSNVSNGDVEHFQRLLTYDCPTLNIYRFNCINLLPDSTLFKWVFPINLSFLYFRKRLKHHSIKGILSIIFRWKKKKLSSAIPYAVIHDGWTQNYYHWTVQALPRLLLLQQAQKPFILLLPEDHQSEFHISSLKLLQIETWHSLERTEQYYRIQNLLYVTHDVQIGDFNDDLILLLHKTLAKPLTQQDARKRVFIRRLSQDRRRILNEEEVLQVFQSFGFQVVEFENLTFEQQISLMGSTGILAGVHGAGLTNMLFMPIGSKVLELTSRVDGDNYYFYSLSNALSHHYFYQVCPPVQTNVVQEANMTVDIKELKETIALLIS